MDQLYKYLLRSLLFLFTASVINCTPTHYTTQSKANTFNDYKSAKYDMKNKKKKRY
jgi:hypothetical protein